MQNAAGADHPAVVHHRAGAAYQSSRSPAPASTTRAGHQQHPLADHRAGANADKLADFRAGGHLRISGHRHFWDARQQLRRPPAGTSTSQSAKYHGVGADNRRAGGNVQQVGFDNHAPALRAAARRAWRR